MERIADAEGYDLLAVMFIDLIAGSTTLHFSGGLAEEAGSELDGTGQNRDFTYGSIMSRKKDVIPLITILLKRKKHRKSSIYNSFIIILLNDSLYL